MLVTIHRWAVMGRGTRWLLAVMAVVLPWHVLQVGMDGDVAGDAEVEGETAHVHVSRSILYSVSE